jgi:hypothetical protein
MAIWPLYLGKGAIQATWADNHHHHFNFATSQIHVFGEINA